VENKENPSVKEIRDESYKAMGAVMQWLSSPRGGDNFYGRIMNGCGRTPKEGVKTACVTLTSEGKYLLLWDPAWFVSRKMPDRILTVIHEAGHIVLQHLERALRLRLSVREPEVFQRLLPIFNIAADMASNDIALRPFVDSGVFKNYKDGFLFPENPQYDFPENQTFEKYLELLIQKAKSEGYNPKTGEGAVPQWMEGMQGHLPWWNELDSMTEDEIENMHQRAKRESKKIVKKAVEQTKKDRGTMPSGLEGLIEGMLEEPQVPWTVMLQNLMKGSITSKLDESTAWPNIGLLTEEAMAQGMEPYPGFQKKPGIHVTVAIDTSGSVSDENFKKFMGEIQGIMSSEQAVSVHVLMFDAAIQHEFILKEDSNIDNQHRYRYGYGGTSFTPALRHILGVDDDQNWEENAERLKEPAPRPDMVVMFTDGYAPVTEEEGGPMPKYEPPCPLMWVITEDGTVHPGMGSRVVKMEY